jgi:RNA polymerase sigma-70 factor (ECF subfamily)
VFLLREVEGLSTAETADALALSEEAVKVRLHRAKARLRADLDRSLGETSAALFGFAGWRCDRTVAAVLRRISAPR